MRTEHELREALLLLVGPTPDVDGVLDRFHRPEPARRPPVRRRPLVVAVGVGLALALVGAVVVPQLARRAATAPAGDRAPSHWAMVSDLEPPPGWSVTGREIFGTYETTTIGDPSGKGFCTVEIDGPGIAPQHPVPSPARSVTVAGRPAVYDGAPAERPAVFWRYRPGAWASVTCGAGPARLGDARTPAELRDLVVGLADGVSFGSYPVRLPVSIDRLPDGYRVESITLDTPTGTASWGITLRPADLTPTTPVIHLGPDLGSGLDPDTRVGDYPATFGTQAVSGPMNQPPGSATSVTTLCLPSAPVPICVSSGNTTADVPAGRRGLLGELAGQISYPTDPADAATWFDARDALPA